MSWPLNRGAVRLRRWLTEDGNPVDVLAAEVGVSAGVITLYARGTFVPPKGLAERLSLATGIDPSCWRRRAGLGAR